jgi:tetratricopeptide (TPR) repeat protein
LLVGTAVYTAVNHGFELFRKSTRMAQDSISIYTLWQDGRYAEVSSIAEKKLHEHPMDEEALLYAGYSRFFLAISRLSAEERNNDLDASIKHLRILLARGDTPHPERVYYLLGKAYLLKGTYWADLSIRYLQLSIDKGYLAEDTFEFIARAYSQMGESEKALYWYRRAAEDHPTDRLLLTLGEEAFRMGLYDEAADYYRQSIDSTRDESLKKRGLSQLGQLYYDVGNYLMARGVLESLVSMEPGNQDYQFLLGETYHELGLEQKARAAWHAVTRINPGHVGALHRLYD